MTAELIFKRRDQPDLIVSDVLSFTYTREAYTPYTELTAVFDGTAIVPADCTEVSFRIGQRLIHHGLIDTLKVTRENGAVRGNISSRSFTALLLENQLTPGFYMNLSVNSLMDNYISLPYVTHEDSSADSGYVYVKSNSVMWDGVVNLAYKLNGNYPYISGCNCVNVTPKQNPGSYYYSEGSLLGIGSEILGKRISSHFHMADLSDTPDVYNYEVPGAAEMSIVRHKRFDLDKRFLYDPERGPVYRGKLSARGWRRKFCLCDGYYGEELYDLVTFGDVNEQRIKKLRITGGAEGIITEISVYDDLFT